MTHLVRHLGAATTAFGLAALLFQTSAFGQTAPAAPAAAASDPSVSERTKKDAAGPLYWIRLNAQKTDTGNAKPAPRIVEIKPAPAPARPAAPTPAPTAVASNPPAAAQAAAATVASNGGGGGLAAGRESAAPTSTAATLPVGTPAGANLAGTAAASLLAPSAPSAATEAARTATAPPPVEEADEPLALLKANEPEFPQVAMRRLRKGNVQVRFEVLPDGRVANASVVQSSNKTLNEAALEAVNSWLFKPVRSPRNAVVDLGFDLDS